MIDKSLLFKKNAEAGKKAMRAFRKYALQNEEATIKECWNHAEYTFRSVVSDYLEEFCDESFRYMYLQNILEDCRDGMICQCKKEFLKIEKRRVWINIQKVYVEQTIIPLIHDISNASNGLYSLSKYQFDYQQNRLKISLNISGQKGISRKLHFHIKYQDLYSDSINHIPADIVTMMNILECYGPFISL